MPNITLPDGSTRSFDAPVSVAEVAQSIGPGLAKSALAGKVDGRLVDLSHQLAQDADVAIITDRDPEGLEVLRHSTAHLLAQAVKELFPQLQVTIGPVVDDGFYYDFAGDVQFNPDNLKAIEKRMEELARENTPVSRETMPRDAAVDFFKERGELYKAEIIESIPSEEDISLYRQGSFTDLCRGPHAPATGKLKAFKLLKVSGSYWRGDARNEQLQRIYGTAWPDKKALKAHLKQMEEAEKRDHRRIGKDLDLFSTQDDAGGGLIFWHPKGARIRVAMEDYWRKRHAQAGYEILFTPHIALEHLWDTSGHTSFYQDSMYKPMEEDGQPYQLRPMNCPFHVLIYGNRPRSYRELPFRWAELGTVYRHEMSGALHGLMRVRGFTQDDAHIFCTEGQLEDEIVAILDLVLSMLGDFGFFEFEVNLSTRPEKSVGSDAIWEKATVGLANALKRRGLDDYTLDEGGGAFYGPKIDIKIQDAIGRKWQCSTVQLDFNLPERFGLEYTGEDGAPHPPIMIHRALLGSLERFFGILIEHFEGHFPAWLAPYQVVVCNITDNQRDYAESVAAQLLEAGFRAKADVRNEKVGFKVREHTLQRVPYMLVVGDREMEGQQVAVRTRAGADAGSMPLSAFMDALEKEVRERSLKPSWQAGSREGSRGKTGSGLELDGTGDYM